MLESKFEARSPKGYGLKLKLVKIEQIDKNISRVDLVCRYAPNETRNMCVQSDTFKGTVHKRLKCVFWSIDRCLLR